MSPFFQTIRILKSCKTTHQGVMGEDFWSFEAIQLLGTNGLSTPPPMTYSSSPTKKTNPLLPDLQLTAQPQLVSQSCLMDGLSVTFILCPLSDNTFYLLCFSRFPLADATDSCTVCKDWGIHPILVSFDISQLPGLTTFAQKTKSIIKTNSMQQHQEQV